MKEIQILGMDILICSLCDEKCLRPPELAVANFKTCPFVCENCRCNDCQIVLDFECECGINHAERSFDNQNICKECYNTRLQITDMEPELVKIREDEIASQGSIYSND